MKRNKFIKKEPRPKTKWCESCGSEPLIETIKNDEKYCKKCMQKLTMEGFNNIGRSMGIEVVEENDEDEINQNSSLVYLTDRFNRERAERMRLREEMEHAREEVSRARDYMLETYSNRRLRSRRYI